MGHDKGNVPLRGTTIFATLLLWVCISQYVFAHSGAEVIRCGFSTPQEILHTQHVREGIILATRPILTDFIESSDGRFRVHYTLTGTDAIKSKDFADVALAAAERAWKTEIDTLGYIAPPGDGGVGGSTAFDIYIRQLTTATGGVYGVTRTEASPYNQSLPLRYPSWIEVDNDFDTAYRTENGVQVYKTHGTEALKATVAHELHHLIQLGSYGDAQTQRMLYEFTSTWMELRVFPEVRDWAVYLNELLRTPNTWPLAGSPASTGYVWGWFGNVLKTRSGEQTLRRAWDGVRNQLSPNAALVDAVNQSGTSLATIFCQESIRLYHTGSRASMDSVIPGADLLNEISFMVDERVSPPGTITSASLRPFEIRPLRFNIPSLNGSSPLSVVMMVSWPDEHAFIQADELIRESYSLQLSADPPADYTRIYGTSWGYKITPPTMCVNVEGVGLGIVDNPYPMPVTNDQQQLFVPVSSALPGENVEITLMDVNMRPLHETERTTVSYDGNRIVTEWTIPVRLSTGVYLVEVRARNEQEAHLHKINVR